MAPHLTPARVGLWVGAACSEPERLLFYGGTPTPFREVPQLIAELSPAIADMRVLIYKYSTEGPQSSRCSLFYEPALLVEVLGMVQFDRVFLSHMSFQWSIR